MQGRGVIHVVDQQGKKKLKVIRSQGGDISLVVGKVFWVEKIELLSRKTLVGKFLGHRVSMSHLSEWIQLEWLPILEYGPIFNFLTIHSFEFIFKCDKDTLKIIKGYWFLDRDCMSIKSWRPYFNTKEEFYASTLV